MKEVSKNNINKIMIAIVIYLPSFKILYIFTILQRTDAEDLNKENEPVGWEATKNNDTL